MQTIDFWYSIGSTYTYLTVMRLSAYAADCGVEFNWRPFDVRTIMMEQNNIPFRDKPKKAAYMWRDIERRAGMYGLKADLPAPYPLEDLVFANQVAVLGKREGWCEQYTVETYRRWFESGDLAGSDPNVSETLKSIGQDPDAIKQRAGSPDIADALVKDTITARDLGVFGSPTFAVGGELFWGDDRLDDAVAWCRHGRLDG